MQEMITPRRPARWSVERCQVLAEDPDLLEAVPPHHRDRATAQCVAAVATLAPGELDDELLTTSPGGIGLLVLGGLLLRCVEVDGRSGAELLGQGDLLRPWQGVEQHTALGQTMRWRVLERTRLAVLDAGAAARLAAFPTLTGCLAGRALDRARSLALLMAIIHQPRIEARVHMLFWHLAERWGRVRSDGVLLPLRLSHSVLADLVCARRPSVTVALQGLAQAQLLRRVDDGWLLLGEPQTSPAQDRAAAADVSSGRTWRPSPE